MSHFVKYKLEDGSELWVEMSDSEGGVVKAGLGDKVQEAKENFDQALESVRLSALQIRKKFHDVQADEVKVKFGLKATGDFGNNVFAVTKVGVEANYEVTLKWNKNNLDEMDERIHQLRLHRMKYKKQQLRE